MVAPMFITFSLHWLFCYLFLCDLRHIYHLPINLTVVRIKVIKVIKLMQGYLMRTSCQITHAALPMLAFMFVNVMFVLWEHGNIMDVLEEKKNFFFFLSDMSLSLLPKQLIATY